MTAAVDGTVYALGAGRDGRGFEASALLDAVFEGCVCIIWGHRVSVFGSGQYGDRSLTRRSDSLHGSLEGVCINPCVLNSVPW